MASLLWGVNIDAWGNFRGVRMYNWTHSELQMVTLAQWILQCKPVVTAGSVCTFLASYPRHDANAYLWTLISYKSECLLLWQGKRLTDLQRMNLRNLQASSHQQPVMGYFNEPFILFFKLLIFLLRRNRKVCHVRLVNVNGQRSVMKSL